MNISETARRAAETEFGSDTPLPLPFAARSRARLAAARQVFARDFGDSDALTDFLQDDDRWQKANALNRILVELTGFGPDFLTIHALSHPDMEPTAETTVLELDMAHYRDQVRDFGKERIPEDYSESLYAFLTMRRDGDNMIYGVHYSACQYIMAKLEDVLLDWVGEYCPVPAGPIASAAEALTDIRRRVESPTPDEKLHAEIIRDGSALLVQMMDEGCAKVFDEDEAWVHHTIQDLDYEIKETIVFSNRKAMGKVRIGNFKADLDALARAGERLEARIKAVTAEFTARLEVLARNLTSGEGATGPNDRPAVPGISEDGDQNRPKPHQ